MKKDEAYRFSDRIEFFRELRRNNFIVEDNHIIYPLKHKPRKCKMETAYVGEIAGERYLVVKTSYMKNGCRFCRRAISKLQKIAREFEE